MTKKFRVKSAVMVAVCLAGLTGCTPSVQRPSIASATATKVTQTNVSWSALAQAVAKTSAASMYKIQSTVSLQNGSSHTSFTVYGTVNLPDKISVQVHENNFNISFYQQGKVAYADEQGQWNQTNALSNIDAFGGYQQIVHAAMADNLPLEKMNRTYVTDEYCDVYRVTMPDSTATVPAFLQSLSALESKGEVAVKEPIQYIFYVGETSGYIRQVQTQSVNSVNQVGPVATNTSTLFYDLDQEKVAQIQIPNSLVKQLENTGQ
ncbi:hypothetical protein [Alicyclobacillus dauci]|uniref:Outer membrane lipoprotein-sorting protein n=1 Tax=Alicyclobacillus dauci TaxID=1475485 RepID=A0ABY6YXU7_9BACL|nr:hypothetical protein [Alicyclobacillus dauci]WAH35445.1 hypothetical protein NZD86_14180 [Alicyclobacillus dauci]